MPYMVIITDTESYNDDVTDIIGPFETEQLAHDAAQAFYDMMDAWVEFSSVFQYEVKPIRTFETSERAHKSLVWMYERADKNGRTLDDDRSWP